jgi:hypothetical protein
VLQLSKNAAHGAERLPLEAVSPPPAALLLGRGVVHLLRKALLLRYGVVQLTLDAVPSTREAVPLLQGAVRKLHEAVRHQRGAVQQRPEAGQRRLDGEILMLTPQRLVLAFSAHRFYSFLFCVKSPIDVDNHT